MTVNLNFQRIIFSVTSIPLFCMLTGCFQSFYKASQQDPNTLAQNMSTPQYENRYFILRNGSNAYNMSNILVSEDRKSISCHLDTLSQDHMLHLVNGRGGKLRYKPAKPEAAVLNEVHFYIHMDTAARLNSDYVLQLDKVNKVEVIEKNQGKTTASYVLGGLGIAVGVIAVVSIIALATKSSCPFVSAYDGSEMKLQGEIYGGAIYPQLCRNDYLKLNMQPQDGMLKLQISNELKEKQFTDFADLLVVTHDTDAAIIPDEKGNLYSVKQPQLPVTATANGKDVMQLLTQNDDLSYNFDDTTAAKENNNQLDLTFNKTTTNNTAKLVLTLKNTYWLDMVYGKFIQGFGSYYPTFIKEQSTRPVEQLERWKAEQQLPLQVSVETNEGWKTVQSLTTTGPLAYRQMVIPIDLANISSNKIHLHINTGFMFWQIDYAAVDFTDNANMNITVLHPVKATDETGANVLPILAKEDGTYLEQPIPGNATVIEYAYNANTTAGKTQTYILHAKGYYEHVRNYTNTADVNFLQQFKKPGALSNYSMQLYSQAMNADVNSLVNK